MSSSNSKMRLCNFRQATLRGAMLRKQRKRLVCLKGPSLGYVRARSHLLRRVPAARNSQSVSTPPELQAPSTAAGIPVPDKTSPPATRKIHPRTFIVDDIDKCVIRRKSKNFYTVRKQLPTIDRLFAVPLRQRLRTHKVFTKNTVFLP